MLKPLKARIKKNVWDNWFGYLGTKRMEMFGNTPYETAQQMAERWLKEMNSATDFFDQDMKRRSFKRIEL